jgi:hypothetical protein
LTITLKSSLLCPEGAALFERHPPHFSTAVYTPFQDLVEVNAQVSGGHRNLIFSQCGIRTPLYGNPVVVELAGLKDCVQKRHAAPSIATPPFAASVFQIHHFEHFQLPQRKLV